MPILFPLLLGGNLLLLGTPPKAPRPFYGPLAPGQRPLLRKAFRPKYGPPLPYDREIASRQAHTLLDFTPTGQFVIVNPERDRSQLERIVRDGLYIWPPASPKAAASNSYIPAEPAPQTAVRSPGNVRSPFPAPPKTDDAEETPAETPVPVVSVPAPPSPRLLNMLLTLAANASANRPLELLSLFRPPYRTAYWQHGGPGTLHSQGKAADIAAYGGYRIRQDDPEACVLMVLALLRDLPPGKYRFGVPKSPETPRLVGRPLLPADLEAVLLALTPEGIPLPRVPMKPETPALNGKKAALKAAMPVPAAVPEIGKVGTAGAALGVHIGLPKPWPFFPPPEPETVNGVLVSGRIVRFRNVGYAPEEALADPRLKQAFAAARKKGIDVIALFPDGVDHLHVDVKTEP